MGLVAPAASQGSGGNMTPECPGQSYSEAPAVDSHPHGTGPGQQDGGSIPMDSIYSVW